MKQDSDIEFDFLNAIEAITDAIEEGNSRETSLCLLNGALAAEPTENIRRCFGLSIKEAVFFAIIFYLQIEDENKCSFKGMAGYLSMPNIEILRMYEVFAGLKRKDLLKIRSEHGKDANQLSIHPKVMRQILQGNYGIGEIKEQNVFELCQRVYNLLDNYNRYDYSANETQFMLSKELDLYDELKELKILREMGLGIAEIGIFFYVSYYSIVYKQSQNIFSIAQCFYNDMKDLINFQNELSNNQIVLVRSNLIAYSSENFHGRDAYELGSMGRKIMGMTTKDTAKFNFKTSIGQLVNIEAKASRKLYFSAKEEKEIKQITYLLKPSNYRKYVRNMRKNKAREGLTLLLYGPSGTGKTQLAYELARSSGREVFLVNASAVRDKFVGESEKNVAQIFSDYEKLCQETKQTPILLLNESDSLISKRMTLKGATEQMNNSMQNILLQKMEDFKGILIATTNLTSNLDKAFERRFLVKLRILKPKAEERFKMLKDNLTEVNSKTLKHIALKFPLTGGQIENIARRWMTDQLISKDVSEERLKDLAQQELSLENGRDSNIKKIGFYNK